MPCRASSAATRSRQRAHDWVSSSPRFLPPMALRKPRIAPGERRAQAVCARDLEEAALVGRTFGFDTEIDLEALLQGLGHPHDLEGAVDRPLGLAHQVRIDRGDMPGGPHGGLDMPARRYDAVHEPH